MPFESINPATGQTLYTTPCWDDSQIEAALSGTARGAAGWRSTPVDKRAELLRGAARILRERSDELARTITLEMGKLIQESKGEIEKCAWVCDYYADEGPAFLADEIIATDAGRSYIAYQPLGTVLAVMPWNFPFWQVFRFAAPALMAGNCALLKHASNVPQCALAIERVFQDAGFPAHAFSTLMISASQVSGVIADPRVHAVTLTGSEAAGIKVASCAGGHLKKTVLELGGADAFIVLEDADLEETIRNAVAARFLNAGQSCIAAKRFIVIDTIADAFVEKLKVRVQSLKTGDPLAESTTLAPMARRDLRDELHQQVSTSIAGGAIAVTGCEPITGPGAFYPASILDRVRPGIPAADEEMFGPVASVIRAQDEADAVRIANDSRFGLGGSVWSADAARGERIARQLESGAAFVNGMVKSDPRLPFGGIKASGYGRELSYLGMREFLNIKTVWVR